VGFILLLLCLPALWPMLSVASWASHDVLHHVFRVASFDAGFRSGTLFPRWAGELGFGYGFPVTHYYAPLAYGVAELFRLAGAGILDSIKLTYAVGFLMSAFGMYWWARSVVGARAAVLAAAAYLYYPYHIADIYMRGTLTEFMALALLPFIMLEARRLVRGPDRGASVALRFALWLAALILTHNLTAFLFLPVIVVYVIAQALAAPAGASSPDSRAAAEPSRIESPLGSAARPASPAGPKDGMRDTGVVPPGARLRVLGTILARTAASVTLAFLLTAFYWLPALTEVGWIRAGQISGSVDDIASLLIPLGSLVSTALLYPYVPDAPAGLQHPLGLIAAITSVLAALALFAARSRLTPEQRRESVIWIIIALATTFALVELSAPLWTAIQPLAYVQYPYRFHAVLGLALSMLAGLGAEVIMRLAGNRETHPPISQHSAQRGLVSNASVAAVIAVMIVSSLGGLRLVPQALPGHKEPLVESQVNIQGMSEYDFQTALWARLYGGPWLLEYLPVWVTEAREEFFLPAAAPVSAAQSMPAPHIVVQDDRPEQRSLQVQSGSAFRLSFHTFYFPAWQVRVDGEPALTYPSGPLALLSADVPAGQHHVTLGFEGTNFQHLGEILSALAAVAFLGFLAWRSRHRWLWLGGGFLMLAAILGWRVLPVAAAVTPQPVAATFDGRIDLVGYAVAPAAVTRNGVVEITLYWFTRQALQEDFKVFVHLDSPNGRAGQADAQPGFNFSPTTRWQAGEVIADHYRVIVSANAVPGKYDIYTGVYRQQPLQNLSVISDNATPDNRVRLGTIVVSN
jgi:hypothetical protein